MCLAFVPSILALKPDLLAFYNPIGWGPLAIASGFPLATWVITTSVLLVRKRAPAAGPVAVPAQEIRCHRRC